MNMTMYVDAGVGYKGHRQCNTEGNIVQGGMSERSFQGSLMAGTPQEAD